MEDRFYAIGKEDADKMRELNPGHEFPVEDLDLYMAKVAWNWFIADMCDDYSKTIREQHGIANKVYEDFGKEINYPYSLDPKRWR